MTTTTALSITHATRIGADLVDRAAIAGMSLPVSISGSIGFNLKLREHEAALLMFRDHDTVSAWANWLEIDRMIDFDVRTELHGDQDVTFTDATVWIEGVRVRLSTNSHKPHEHRHEHLSVRQIDATTSVAKCVCGKPIISNGGPWFVKDES